MFIIYFCKSERQTDHLSKFLCKFYHTQMVKLDNHEEAMDLASYLKLFVVN